MTIPERIIDEIRDRVNIADIISESVTLKRSGRSLMGLCPFHSEKTPSFSVREQEGDFHCFGCGKRGTVYNFLMESRGMTFPEAVRFLASRAGVTIPSEMSGDDRREEEARRRSQKLRSLMREAAKIYRDAFRNEPMAEEARSYLARRKVRPEALEQFAVGFAPERRDFLLKQLEKRAGDTPLWKKEELVPLLRELGLLQVRSGDESSAPFDTFRDRVVFPIMRSDSSVVALGGRALHEAPGRPKYLNTVESVIYQKRRTLYGISQGLEAARKARTAYLVEGYMDVIAMHQLGLKNSFATCGTAVTPEHALVLRRFVDKLYLVFDGDSAGSRAASVGFEMFLNSGIEVKTVLLPDGEDPSSLAENLSPEQFAALAEERSYPAVDVYLKNLSGTGDSSPALLGKVAEQFAKVLLRVRNAVEREAYLKRGAEQLGVSMEAFLELVAGSRQGRRERILSSPPPAAAREQVRPRAPEAPRAPAPPRPRPAPAAQPARNAGLSPFIRQLMVAVLTEPGLATVIKEMRCLGGETAVLEKLPQPVRDFLDDLEASTPAGVQSGKAGPGAAASNEALQAMLDARGLGGFKLIEETIRQLTVGGGNPAGFVEALPATVERQQIGRAVRQIRHEEAKSEDRESLGKLAQDKLIKRRLLDQLRGAR